MLRPGRTVIDEDDIAGAVAAGFEQAAVDVDGDEDVLARTGTEDDPVPNETVGRTLLKVLGQ